MLPAKYSLLGLRDINWSLEIPEPFFTFEDNAKAKVTFIYTHTNRSCFADDSGLEIDALDGKPGVLSARYAGENKNHVDNIEKVLQELGNTSNRKARFHSAIAYMTEQNEINVFTGHVEGRIGYNPAGEGGFGYDPIFIPDGFDLTFAQLSENIKNSISHRAIAMRKFIAYLAASVHKSFAP